MVKIMGFKFHEEKDTGNHPADKATKHQYEEQTEQLIEIISCHYPIMNEIDENIIDCLNCIRINKTRLTYRLITEKMYSTVEEDHSIILHNLNYFNDYALSILEDGKCTQDGQEAKWFEHDFWLKIYDHIHLASIQKKKMDKLTEEYEKALMKNAETYNEMLNDIEVRIKNINFDIISILSLFTGVTFVIFGGVTLVSKIELGASTSNFMMMIFVGYILINALTMLLHLVNSSKRDLELGSLIYKQESEKMVFTKYAKANLYFIYYFILLFGIIKRDAIYNLLKFIYKEYFYFIPYTNILIPFLIVLIPFIPFVANFLLCYFKNETNQPQNEKTELI